MLEYVLKYAILILSATMIPFLIVWGTFVIGQLFVLGPVVFSLMVGSPASLWLLLLGPFAGLVVVLWLRNAIATEVHLLKRVGRDKILWVAQPTLFGLASGPLHGMVATGWDMSGPILQHWTSTLGLPQSYVEQATGGVMVLASHLWADFVTLCEPLLALSVWVWFWFSFTFLVWGSVRIGMRLARAAWLVYFLFVTFLLFTPASTVSDLVIAVLRFIVGSYKRDISGEIMLIAWIKTWIMVFITDVTISLEGLNSEVRRTYSEKLAGRRTRAVVLMRQTLIRSVKLIDDLALPEFVRNRFSWTNSVAELEQSRELMADLGWPVNVDIAEPTMHDAAIRWKDWLVTGTDFATGLRTMRTHLADNLDHLRPIAMEYRRTESYQSVDNELDSTARYFQKREVSGLPNVEDDLWELVGTIFRNSRLTPFNTIISKWVKKYALGFWMRDPDNSRAKYKRSKFISTMGYSNFKKLWARTFYYASQILPVAHVSVKGEALPPKKWENGLVRSIIGSPITQYIFSTIMNYGPNHNFDWETTPIKVGMPLNGYWISDLFSKHGRFQIHVEGDFTAFDSTIDGGVLEMVKTIRKRGFNFHRDRTRICELIDINYDQVLGQALGHTTTGNVYRKGTGETTGHSATSMDNSLALVTLYIAAWKEITGKSAREFLSYNELSCYGDDHLLSIAGSHPRAWTPRNIRRVMANWGVTNNLQVKRLQDCEFLSKRCANTTSTLAKEMRDAGVPLRPYAVWHNKAKLAGKLVAPLKNVNPTYQVTRLLSYITLTAHHRDVYDGIVKAFESRALSQALKASKLRIPSYAEVMRSWYNPSAQPFVPEPDPEVMLQVDGKLVHYGTPTIGDYVLGALSQVPDLLNPVVFNLGFARAMQSQLAPTLVWVVDFIATTNGAPTPGMLKWAMKGSVYHWLDPDVCVPGTSRSNFSSMLVRHWLFLAYCRLVPDFKTFHIFEFIVRRLANLQFIINGYVHRDFPKVNPSFDRVIVAALLGIFVQVPDWFQPLAGLHIPEVSVWLDYAWNRTLSWVWQNVPSNYNELNPLFAKGFGKNSPLLISAPTGTGKSTGLVNHLSTIAAVKFRKIIVVEPRSLLAVGLRDFMKASYGLDCTAGTLGEDFEPGARVWYITPESLLAHFHLVTKDCLFVLDECHIEEESYTLVKNVLNLLPVGQVWVTATPSTQMEALAKMSIDLPVASIWAVEERKTRLNAPDPVHLWLQTAKQLVSQVRPSTKIAIIVDTPQQAEDIASCSNRPVQVLSGRSERIIDTTVDVYVCTSVIDVGVTIPNLDEIHFPGWEYNGIDRFVLSPLTYRQRKGRVGRMRNGIAHAYWPSTAYPSRPASTNLTVKQWAGLIKSGVSPAIVNHFNPIALAETLGLNSELTKSDNWKDIVRASHVFLSNMKPVFMANTVADRNANLLGRPVTLHQTGAGNLSSSWPQDNDKLFKDACLATAAVVQQSMGLNVSDEQKDVLNSLASIAGPVVSVKNLAASLVNDLADGMTELLNPKNRVPSGSTSELAELPKIMKLLKDASQLAEEI